MAKCVTYTVNFKAKVALAALKDNKTPSSRWISRKGKEV